MTETEAPPGEVEVQEPAEAPAAVNGAADSGDANIGWTVQSGQAAPEAMPEFSTPDPPVG